jgi:predicted CopG family antitoxin
MGAADKQIRVSETVKREIERRRREGESYNDVLERMFSPVGDRDLLAGFGRWSDERADRAREVREEYEKKSKERMGRRSDNA